MGRCSRDQPTDIAIGMRFRTRGVSVIAGRRHRPGRTNGRLPVAQLARKEGFRPLRVRAICSEDDLSLVTGRDWTLLAVASVLPLGLMVLVRARTTRKTLIRSEK